MKGIIRNVLFSFVLGLYDPLSPVFLLRDVNIIKRIFLGAVHTADSRFLDDDVDPAYCQICRSTIVRSNVSHTYIHYKKWVALWTARCQTCRLLSATFDVGNNVGVWFLNGPSGKGELVLDAVARTSGRYNPMDMEPEQLQLFKEELSSRRALVLRAQARLTLESQELQALSERASLAERLHEDGHTSEDTVIFSDEEEEGSIEAPGLFDLLRDDGSDLDASASLSLSAGDEEEEEEVPSDLSLGARLLRRKPKRKRPTADNNNKWLKKPDGKKRRKK